MKKEQIKPQFYNLKNDIVFKTFFSRKGNEEFLIVLDEHREYEVRDNLQWYFIELPKFRKQNPDMSDKLNQWLVFLDGERKEWVEMAEKNNETLQRARKEMNYLEGDEAVRRLVELREKWDMDYNSEISYAKKEGVKEGIKETAKKMLAKNIDIEDIMEMTGLTKEEIENLK